MRRSSLILPLMLAIPVVISSCRDTLNDALTSWGKTWAERIETHEDEIALQETQIGKNTLAFTVDGRIVRQVTYSFRSYRFAKYSEHIEDNCKHITIIATLNNGTFKTFELDVLADEIKENIHLIPQKIKLEYYYKTNFIDGSRMSNYREVSISDPMISITQFHDKIFAGNFSFKGEYIDSTGTTHHFTVDDGIFDLTNVAQPIRWE